MLREGDKNQSPDLLYKELVAIGRTEKTIRPEALMRYKHLLHSPEVQRRAGHETDPRLLAFHASRAICDAVTEIVAKDMREIAEAALCVTPQFEGKRVSERWRDLPGITENIFKYRRKLAFNYIVEFLTRDAPITSAGAPMKPSNLDQASTHGDPSYYSTLLAKRAATLHYAGLSILFANDIDEVLRAQGKKFPRSTFSVHGFPLRNYLFRAYVDFIYSSYPSGTSDTDTGPASAFLEYAQAQEHLSPDIVTELIKYWQMVADRAPIGPSKVTEAERSYLSLVTFDQDFYAGDALRLWSWWLHRTGFDAPKEHLASLVGPLVALSGAFVAILSRNANLTGPTNATARMMAHRAIASCYEFDEWAPLIEGRSLRDRADTYFDSEGPRLTHQVL